jgi:hypothetical protein
MSRTNETNGQQHKTKACRSVDTDRYRLIENKHEHCTLNVESKTQN